MKKLNKSVSAYYENLFLDQANKSLVYFFTKGTNRKLTYWETVKYKVDWYVCEMKNRLHYALEALKGNYGEYYD